MSRSGYSEDYDEQFPNALALYRSSVDQAINGKRGQAFLRELVESLDAMPDKRLISDELVYEGDVCAIGSVGVRRGLDMTGLSPTDPVGVAKKFGIAECLVREIVFENDEVGGAYWVHNETPEARWQRMRDWAARHLKSE